jgi:hypothetical protein
MHLTLTQEKGSGSFFSARRASLARKHSADNGGRTSDRDEPSIAIFVERLDRREAVELLEQLKSNR